MVIKNLRYFYNLFQQHTTLNSAILLFLIQKRMAENDNYYDQGYNKTCLSDNSSMYNTIVTEDTLIETSR